MSCLSDCFRDSRLVLTEGAVGQRIEHEYGLKPDPDIMYAGLIYDPEGRAALTAIYCSYLQVAVNYNLPILLMTNTRRANKDRVLRSKFKERKIMRDYNNFLCELTTGFGCTAYIGGMMGCKGDAYSGSSGLDTEEAMTFHTWQFNQFDPAQTDFFFAGIMPALPEAVGMAKVMEMAGKPYIISLMINPNGTILDGHTLHEAIFEIDCRTKQPPLCYMTNCVHPSILRQCLIQPENQTALVRERFCGIQANAACLDPQTLDKSNYMMTSDPDELAISFKALHTEFPLKIYGGCCGTDENHIRALAKALM